MMNNKISESQTEKEQHRIKELEQEVEIMGEYISLLSQSGLSTKKDDKEHEKKELEQEKIILDELNKSLEQKNEIEITQFLDLISHEITAPLTPIKAYAEMLKDEKFGDLGEIQKQKLKTIDDNSRELIQLVTNMSGYKKFALGKQQLKLEKVDIKKIIHEAHLFFSSELDSHGMKINSTFSKPLWLMCDSTLLFQVFTNFLKLAFYTISKKSGKIIVNVWERKSEVEITFSYNEKLLSQVLLNKVFSKSYRIDTKNLKTNSGLALALSHNIQIINAHGGKIWCDDKSEEFSSIIFTLPTNGKELQ